MEPVEIREFRSRIGRAIRKLRAEERISAQFLASVLGVTQPTVSRIENGNTSIAAERLLFLAKSFNRPLSFFVGGQSPIVYDETDILNAGLVFYGAGHIKCKRTIDINKYYRTYADFLNAALTEVDDTRFAVALGSTLYNLAVKNELNITKIVSTVIHGKLISNLKALIEIINFAKEDIRRPSKEKKYALKKLLDLYAELDPQYKSTSSLAEAIKPKYFAEFLYESIGVE